LLLMLLLLLLPHCQEGALHLPWKSLRTKSTSSTAQSTDIRTAAKVKELGLVCGSTDVHVPTGMPQNIMSNRVRYLMNGRRATDLWIARKATKTTIYAKVVEWLGSGAVSVNRAMYSS